MSLFTNLSPNLLLIYRHFALRPENVAAIQSCPFSYCCKLLNPDKMTIHQMWPLQWFPLYLSLFWRKETVVGLQGPSVIPQAVGVLVGQLVGSYSYGYSSGDKW